LSGHTRPVQNGRTDRALKFDNRPRTTNFGHALIKLAVIPREAKNDLAVSRQNTETHNRLLITLDNGPSDILNGLPLGVETIRGEIHV
jgi:hypothetical protein